MLLLLLILNSTLIFLTTKIFECEATQIVVIDAVEPLGHLSRFWDYTGFSPPGHGKLAIEYLSSRDIEYNLALISALPLKGISYVRIHWLFDLILLKNNTGDGYLEYDFSHLDRVINLMMENELHPVFELMGNPGGIFSDINNNITQIEQWKELVTIVVFRFIRLYGIEEVRKWRFETWNEPDLKQYNVLNFTVAGYLRYVKASRIGLNDAMQRKNETLKFGGPAGLFKKRNKHKLCWEFLSHCSKRDCQLDFISFHKKGNRSAAKVVEESLQMYDIIKDIYNGTKPPPPVANTEADILSGWWRNEAWRGDVRYAASISMVLAGIIDKLNDHIFILSNDNGFLNYYPYFFTQRTLLSRFQMNNTLDKHSQFFEKPVYSVMGLLAYLGDEKLRFSSTFDNRLGIIATRNRNGSTWTASIILVWSTDNMDVNSSTTIIRVKILLPNISGKYVIYTLENTKPHPYRVWLEAGSPVFPTADLRRRMREAQGAYLTSTARFEKSLVLDLKVEVSMPSVSLINICEKMAINIPGKVSNLRAFNVTFNEVLILWSDVELQSRCILMYEVQFCQGECEDGNFKRINRMGDIALSFHFSHVSTTKNPDLAEQVIGKFKVRAIDLWNRLGVFSNVLHYKN